MIQNFQPNESGHDKKQQPQNKRGIIDERLHKANAIAVFTVKIVQSPLKPSCVNYAPVYREFDDLVQIPPVSALDAPLAISLLLRYKCVAMLGFASEGRKGGWRWQGAKRERARTVRAMFCKS